MSDRRFPIQDRDHRGREMESWIPWGAIEPHGHRAMQNHGQTLERLAERGGLCPSEAVAVLTDTHWDTVPEDGARARMRELVDQWRAKTEGRPEP